MYHLVNASNINQSIEFSFRYSGNSFALLNMADSDLNVREPGIQSPFAEQHCLEARGEDRMANIVARAIAVDKQRETIRQEWTDFLWLDGAGNPQDGEREPFKTSAVADPTGTIQNVVVTHLRKVKAATLLDRAKEIEQQQAQLAEDMKQASSKPWAELAENLDALSKRKSEIQMSKSVLGKEWQQLLEETKKQCERKRGGPSVSASDSESDSPSVSEL